MLKFKDLMERINETRSLNLEEAEELDEISQMMARAARDKAGEELAGHRKAIEKEWDKQGRSSKPNYGKVSDIQQQMKRRERLSDKVTRKLAKEEADQIDELSVNTVRGYYNKAGEQGKKISDKMKMGGGDWSKDGSDTKTLKKRAAGRTMALKRRSGEVKMSEDAEQTDEALKGNQHKIDANKNGKVDGHDFKILRNAKKARYQ